MNQLHKLKQFQEILANYHISDTGKQILKDTPLMLFAAATSAGRNKIIDELVKTGRYHFIVSDTTRKPRVNEGKLEKNGEVYWFRTEEEMLNNLLQGNMLEAAIIHQQQISGISIDELKKAKDTGKTAITDIEMIGTKHIVDAKTDTICLFIIPPSFDEWQKRLKQRGLMDPSEVRRRLTSAVGEFETALAEDYYWIIVNDKLDDAVTYIDNIARGLPSSPETQQRNRNTLKTLLEQTKAHLT